MPFWSMLATMTYWPCGPAGISPPTFATPADSGTPAVWSAVSAGVTVTPVPAGPAAPTAVMVTFSGLPNGSMSSVSPTANPTPVRLSTFTLVLPAGAGAARVDTLVCE